MADRLTPEMIDAALTYADSWDEGPPEQLHTVVLAAALREAQAERDEAREIVEHLRRHGCDWLDEQFQEREKRLREAMEPIADLASDWADADLTVLQLRARLKSIAAFTAALAAPPPANEAKVDDILCGDCGGWMPVSEFRVAEQHAQDCSERPPAEEEQA